MIKLGDTSNKQSLSGTNRINESIRDTGNKKKFYEVDEKFDDDFYDKLASDDRQQKPTKAKNNDDDKQLQFYSTSKLIIARL